ncbi:MAG: DUF2459 domain-containing protein [Pirellulaceae bacterium]
MAAFFGAACLVGLSPVNTQFQNAPGGTEVFVYTDHLQSKILLPVRTKMIDWNRHFPQGTFENVGDEKSYVGDEKSYLAFSWEDRDFALNTPTWNDTQCSTALRAAFVPSEAVMHVQRCERPEARPGFRRVLLDNRQYGDLSQQIMNSFDVGADRKPRQIASRDSSDVFFAAHGVFYFLNTGNNWTGACLKKCGVQTGMWTPFTVGLAQVSE